MATRKKPKVEAETPTLTCEHCRYFKPGADHNECRANPPTMVTDLSDGGHMSLFPMVEPSDWCGFFMPRLNS